MRNTKVSDEYVVNRQVVKPEKVYTQEEIDLLDLQFKEREEKYKRLIDQPINGLLEQYRKNLISTDTQVEKETIIFDQTTRKWKIIKEESKNEK